MESDNFIKKVYSGTQNDFKGIPCLASDEFGWGLIAFFDLPLSIVADTIILPYTIPYDKANYTKRESNNINIPQDEDSVSPYCVPVQDARGR